MNKLIAFVVFILIFMVLSCKSDTEVLDCSTLTGATFNTNGGKLESILNTKCSGPACHSSGGAAANHWVVGPYTNLGDHFFSEAGETVAKGTMPPAGSSRLSSTELNLFECWKEANYPK